jgi:hypothetical protein
VKRRLPVSFFRLPWLKRTIPLFLLVAAESLLQRLGGPALLTPSVFVLAQAEGKPSSLAKVLAWRCPACESLDLREADDAFECRGCGRKWTKTGGIYDFRHKGS